MSQAKYDRQWFAERPYIIAIMITLVLVLWMGSGVMKAQEMPEEKSKENEIVPKVKVETLRAQEIFNTVELFGRTEPDRTTNLKAEIAGRVDEVLAKRGAFVEQGQIIARLAENDLKAQLNRSKSLLEQRKIEYKGAKKLNASGYQAESALSKAKANLEAVKADIVTLELALEHTIIRAPYAGVLNTRFVEQGDYVKSGDPIAMIADLSPLVVRGFATENQVGALSVGQKANVKILNQGNKVGIVRYIASVADDKTNTFKVEIAIDNEETKLLAGLSSEVEIPLNAIPAIKISPALLALDELGNIGVKSVKEDIVVFTPINIVKTESDGIWLSGLGQQAEIITLGQGFVRSGDKVEAVRDNAGE